MFHLCRELLSLAGTRRGLCADPRPPHASGRTGTAAGPRPIRYVAAPTLESSGVGLGVNAAGTCPTSGRVSVSAPVPPTRFLAHRAARPLFGLIASDSRIVFLLFAVAAASAGSSPSSPALRPRRTPTLAPTSHSRSLQHSLFVILLRHEEQFPANLPFRSSFMNNPG